MSAKFYGMVRGSGEESQAMVSLEQCFAAPGYFLAVESPYGHTMVWLDVDGLANLRATLEDAIVQSTVSE